MSKRKDHKDISNTYRPYWSEVDGDWTWFKHYGYPNDHYYTIPEHIYDELSYSHLGYFGEGYQTDTEAYEDLFNAVDKL